MKETKIYGIYKDKKQLFTVNLKELKGQKVYGEKIIKKDNTEYRSWNPYRSKLAALILKKSEIELRPDFSVLYLGAATGTTVSHLSDILKDGVIYAVENSAISMKKLIKVCEKRKNIIPIFEDAFHFEKYQVILTKVDLIYQDISQRNQSEIFIGNLEKYLKKDGLGILMVKSRSIDVSLKPNEAYDMVCDKLQDKNLKILDLVDLSPYEKDHAAIIIEKYANN